MYFFFFNNRDLGVVHTSPMKTYGKRKKHSVLFSDSSEEESNIDR